MIWSLCLGDAHVMIYGSVRGHEMRSLKVHQCYLDERSGFVVDISTCSDYPRVKGSFIPVVTEGLTSFKHGVSYDTTVWCPAGRRYNNAITTFTRRLPALWRVCKLAYNETCNTQFTSGNIFDFNDSASFMLLHKYDPHLTGRIQTLAMPKYLERNLSLLVRLQSDGSSEPVSEDDKVIRRKRTLQRLLPALTDIWLESHMRLVSATTPWVNHDFGHYLSSRFGQKRTE
jgi:hypothetical protein